ncbi:MAG: SDR family oxidoreductase [Bacteroidales bacterium]|nr:SDR family oxidoreductase [Bacteroidales bacterium]
MIKYDFTGKVVLVTGSSRGIGRATAAMFAGAGADVILHFNQNEEAAKKAFSNLKKGNHLLVQADLSDPFQVEGMCTKCFEKYGKIDILVNNAGVFEEFDVLSLSYKDWLNEWDKTIKINLNGAANLSFLVAKQMKDKDGCKIINISSRGAFRGEPDAPAYGASKAGMNSFGQSMAKAFAKYGIYVYTIAPGFVETDMAALALEGDRGKEIRSQTPLNRVAQPEEIAQTILFLASEGTEYMTGCIVDMNGASYLRS